MKKIHRYTLVELLVVVAIAAVILGIATPAFTAMMKGGAMTSTTRELAAKIKAARSYAVTNNCYVALVFPTGKDWSSVKPAFSYRAYRPCVVYKDENEDWVFDSWIDGEGWKTMNKGIIIAKDKTGKFEDNATTSDDDDDVDTEFFIATIQSTGKVDKVSKITEIQKVPLGRLNSEDDDDREYNITRAIIFKPNGQLAGIDSNKQLRFRLIEGVPVTSTSVQVTNVYTEDSKKYAPAQYFIINPLTCKITFSEKPVELKTDP